MREHWINEKNNFICGYYGNTEICDELISYFKTSENKRPGCVGKNTTIDSSVKDSTDLIFNEECELRCKYVNYLQENLKHYVEKYKWCNEAGGPWAVLKNGVQIQYYKPGGAFFEWHTERGSNHEPIVTRHIAFMTYLNDVHDEGETEFYYQNIKIKPEKGLTLFWPTDWTFTHRGVPSNTEEKYIATGWYNFT